MTNDKFVKLLREGVIKEFLKLADIKNINDDDSERLLQDKEFFCTQLVVAFFEMLKFKIPSDDHCLEEYLCRDELKIFLIVTLIESISKLNNKKQGSKAAFKSFCCKYFLSHDKDLIENKILANKQPISFCQFVDILYKVRCNFTHEGEYICQFFYHPSNRRGANYHEYQNIEKLRAIKSLEIGIDFMVFKRIIINAIKNYLNIEFI